MRGNLLFLVAALLLVFLPPAVADVDGYYQIKVQGKATGYIQCQTHIVRQSQQAVHTRKTFTYFQFQGKSEEDRQIFETTVFYPPHKVTFYSLDYLKEGLWEEHRYWFEKDKIIITTDRNGQRVYHKTIPFTQDFPIITDYFSLLPFLAHKRPQFLLFVDPKQIDLIGVNVPTQRINIAPQGERLLNLYDREYRADIFSVVWKEARLKFWISRQDELLQIEEATSGTSITFTTKDKILQAISNTEPTKKREIPFALNKNYRYIFKYQNKKVGHLDFQIQKIERPKITYKVLANGTLSPIAPLRDENKPLQMGEVPSVPPGVGTRASPSIFHSQTVYDENWQPTYYHIKENTTEIDCEFVLQGVKAKFQRGENVLARFIAISEQVALLDNNGIHHFAIFLTQLDLKGNGKLYYTIFHPRRMQYSKGELNMSLLKDGNYEINLHTTHHQLRLLATPRGKLLYYSQGNLEVYLEDELKSTPPD